MLWTALILCYTAKRVSLRFTRLIDLGKSLSLLSNERQACDLIIEMMADLFSLLKAELEFPQTQTNPTARQAVVTSLVVGFTAAI